MAHMEKSVIGTEQALVLSRPTATRSEGIAEGLWRTIKLWRRRALDRAALGRFSRRDMRDLGLSPSDVQREIRKPFWRA
jgi:uncharacterized protein YjiS (DUF1127 family)